MQKGFPDRRPAYGRGLLSSAAALALAFTGAASVAAAEPATMSHANDSKTKTPIEHVIVIIGENRTFDHVFATYKPVKKGETVLNLLSEKIINANGTPGADYFNIAAQYQAQNKTIYDINPKTGKLQYKTLPAPLASGGYSNGAPPFKTIAEAMTFENGLSGSYYKYLTTGGVPASLLGKPDTRIKYDGKTVNNLPAGPYQLTPGVGYDDYAESPVHRFYQMWQQRDCSAAQGCLNDLFAWVEATVGAGSNGAPPPKPFTYKEGATALGFYNVQQGDWPIFKMLADKYAMSDNYHQAVSGGTGANHIMLGTGDAIYFSDGKGNPLVPPNNQWVARGSKNGGKVAEVENPNPLPGTNNWYTQDGYGAGSFGSPSSGGGSYTDCGDLSQPGVKPIVDYLKGLPQPVKSRCQPGYYYLLNNYNPGYFGNGVDAYARIGNPGNTVFTVPPSNVKNIADTLLENQISFAYFGDQFNAYLQNPYNNYVTPDNTYCNICNFLQYSSRIMKKPQVRRAALQDTSALYGDIGTTTSTSDNLPAVSFVKPSGYLDGHPGSSKPDLLEGFVEKIVAAVQANPALAANTVIFITTDEGGGYYDSGYVQPLDYFGDGTRIPLIAVSKYSKSGYISHTYTDHVSILKFIEYNWNLPPVTGRSRDNFPNPVASKSDPYVPTNGPAIGDLTDMFSFPKK